MSASNVTVRSNVFIRKTEDVGHDREFIAQVRGRAALETLLERLHPGFDRVDAARKHFSHGQLAEVAWQARCGHCGAFPEGPVLVNGKVEVQFRCPRQACPVAAFSVRTVLIDVELIRRSVDTLKQPFEAIVQEALKQPITELATALVPEVERVPITLRMSLTQKYVFTDAHIENAVRRHLVNSGGG
jgi:hypothetical protein